MQKIALSLCPFGSSTTSVILSQGLSVCAPFSLELYLNYYVSIEIQGLSRCMRTLPIQGVYHPPPPTPMRTITHGQEGV